MRNILGLKIETKVSLLIVVIFVAIFLVTVFKSVKSFNKFSDQINDYAPVVNSRLLPEQQK